VTLAELRRRMLAFLYPPPKPAQLALDRLRWIVPADRATVPCAYWQHVSYDAIETLHRIKWLGWKRARYTWRWTVRR
jgi:hypothetical protein